jgi:hypothetical protein
VLALGLALGLCGAAAAQQKPSIAVLPAQHYSADAYSAERLTQALIEEFRAQGYSPLPMERVREAADSLGFSPARHYSDAQVAAIGRHLNVQLVAYPRLLSVGYPATEMVVAAGGSSYSAVLHLRVVRAQTHRALYCRQIAREFPVSDTAGDVSIVPQSVASAAAGEVSRLYFQRVAGSREEIGGE